MTNNNMKSDLNNIKNDLKHFGSDIAKDAKSATHSTVSAMSNLGHTLKNDAKKFSSEISTDAQEMINKAQEYIKKNK
ncbi:hypothetical protein KQI30_10670 [Clostridium bornimense]|uniref:hypothetical protein n=1 Tax=Clostridium bornimense TaxID=1216932 RepID=UPI001C10298F|nr:hypothetical protein [Clostridium bornimense]MBU5316733.1 hypothetical protein [Clostridium bornimense]